MSRTSKLSEKQWLEIERRLEAGESVRALAREFKISPSAISARFSEQQKKIKKVTNQIVEANQALKSLPLSAQISVHNRTQRLMAIQAATDDAAIAGSNISKIVSEAAHRRVKAATDDELIDAEYLKSLMAAGMVSNTHAKIGLDVMSIASKEKAVEPDSIGNETRKITYEVLR